MWPGFFYLGLGMNINTNGDTWREIEKLVKEQIAQARAVTDSPESKIDDIRVSQGVIRLGNLILDHPHHQEIEIKLER